jgi:UPF0042 nucleotide-binding protein
MVEMVLITGLSGAGKTSTLKIFEDYGYFAIDNLPLNFLESLAKLMFNTKFSKIALGMDIRSLFNCSVDEFVESIKNIKKLKEIKLTVIYVTAKKEIILERFRNTKRTHPLMKEGLNLNQCIDKEQELMEKIASISDYVIDSSDLSINKLRSKLKSALIQREGIEISITSFGYKYGIPLDADLVLDVRMLPNPFYVEDLKKFTGHDKDIKEYLSNFDLVWDIIDKYKEIITLVSKAYSEQDRNYLNICVGCTGGRHRSVFVAEKLCKFLRSQHYNVKLLDRDIKKDN